MSDISLSFKDIPKELEIESKTFILLGAAQFAVPHSRDISAIEH